LRATNVASPVGRNAASYSYAAAFERPPENAMKSRLMISAAVPA